MRGLVHHEGELGLRIFGMHQEGRAAIDVAAQQAQAFIGRVPRLHHDVVEFVAQEVFDHALVLRFDFEEIRQHAHGSEPTLQRSRLEQAANRFRGVTMLGDDRFERSLLAQSRGELGAQAVELTLGFVFLVALGFRAY